MLKELVRRDGYDDLAELRRMIKITGDNLDDYERKVLNVSMIGVQDKKISGKCC